ncbi:copper-fist-domain-containing protein [Paxillus ammoniavirescens]|nr:copper-fist-domain-containing protein [Paxillus ammoniavirescens]
MVFVNDKKFACESCIKGHRSSSCHHTERPLFEVKKKGRPVSQCPKCRELRQAKRVHSRCTCTPRQPTVDKIPIPAARPDKKPRRFMPSVPTLPNGISDAFQPTTISIPPNSRQLVDSLLNPCYCDDVRQCTCGSPCVAGPSSSERPVHPGLMTLAEAAVMFQELPMQKSTSPRSMDRPSGSYSCIDERPSVHVTTPPQHLELPPILAGSTFSGTIPDFPVIPPLSTIKSIAGSGCTCGFRCTCPGCIEHRGLEHAEKDHKDCTEGCGHCVDHTTGIELPSQDTSSWGGNLVDTVFAHTAPLPNPPHDRRAVMNPGDVAVYPNELFSGSSSDTDERGAAFGLMRIPKLECYRGQRGRLSDGGSSVGCCGNSQSKR